MPTKYSGGGMNQYAYEYQLITAFPYNPHTADYKIILNDIETYNYKLFNAWLRTNTRHLVDGNQSIKTANLFYDEKIPAIYAAILSIIRVI